MNTDNIEVALAARCEDRNSQSLADLLDRYRDRGAFPTYEELAAVAATPAVRSSDDAIELAARAMAESIGWKQWDTATDFTHTHSGNDPEEERDHFRGLARIALPFATPASPTDAKIIGYGNGDELENMLDDRAAMIYSNKSGYHSTPVYLAAPASQAVSSEAVHQWRKRSVGSWSDAWIDATKEEAYSRVDEHYEARTLYLAINAAPASSEAGLRADLTVEAILKVVAKNTGKRISLSNDDLDCYVAVVRALARPAQTSTDPEQPA